MINLDKYHGKMPFKSRTRKLRPSLQHKKISY